MAVVACGSSSTGPSLSQFKAHYEAERATFQKLRNDVTNAITSAAHHSNSALASEFGRLATRATAVAVALHKLNAPAKYKSEVAQLSSDYDTAGADLKAISAAATAGSGPDAKTAVEKLALDATKLQLLAGTITKQLGLPANG
jgi:hypothetical protein